MSTTLLDYLRVLWTGPTFFGVLALTFLIMYRPELRRLISSVALLKSPLLGFEITTHQIIADNTRQVGSPSMMNSHSEPKAVDGSQGAEKLNTQQGDELRAGDQNAAKIWEFQYLNYFLAWSSQQVLNWIVLQNRMVTHAEYEAYWSQWIADPAYRKNTIQALLNHALIAVGGDSGGITPKGLDYTYWPGRKHHGAVNPANAVAPLLGPPRAN